MFITIPSDGTLAKINWKQTLGLIAAITAVVVVVEIVAGRIAGAIVS